MGSKFIFVRLELYAFLFGKTIIAPLADEAKPGMTGDPRSEALAGMVMMLSPFTRLRRRYTTSSPRTRLRFLLSLVAALTSLVSPVSGSGTQAAPGQANVITALRQGDAQGALSLAQAALKHAPRDCSLLSLEAIAFTGLHQQQPALNAFEKALAICPEYLPALMGAAQIRVEQASPSAIPLLERTLKVQPENATVQGMLATALRGQSRCDDALPHYRSSSVLFTSRPDLQQGYGSCLAATGDPKAALEQYVSLLQSRPNDSIRYDVALLQWRNHAIDEALATLSPLLEERSSSAALGLASKIHEERGETPQAVNLLRRAILASPDDPANYLDFAAIAFNHKSFHVGIDMLDAGLERNS